MEEQVNHPRHYNRHPAGIECIDIIRHYTCDIANAIKYLWRAGLKSEEGKDSYDKAVEDLEKALWYIDDYQRHCRINGAVGNTARPMFHDSATADMLVEHMTGHSSKDITRGYPETIAKALTRLLRVGVVYDAEVIVPIGYHVDLHEAEKAIRERLREMGRTVDYKED